MRLRASSLSSASLFTRSNATLILAVLLLALIGAEPTTKPDRSGDLSLAPKFQFIGLWRGPTGFGTTELISPSWIITAAHVAKHKADDSSLAIRVQFDNGINTTVAEAFVAPHGDLAIARLAKPVNNITPVPLLDHAFVPDDGQIDFTMAGHSGGLHIHPGRHGHARSESIFIHEVSKEDPAPGRGGDSGGTWAVESNDRDKHPILFAVVHGGGAGIQPASVRDWIDKTLEPTHETVKWEHWQKP